MSNTNKTLRPKLEQHSIIVRLYAMQRLSKRYAKKITDPMLKLNGLSVEGVSTII